MKQYCYFVSYNFSSKIGSGFGNCTMKLNQKIRANNCNEMLSFVRQNIFDNIEMCKNVTIINFQLIEE